MAPDQLGAVLKDAQGTGAEGGWLAVGDGAVRYREQVEAAGAVVPGDRDSMHRVTAEAVCRLGAHLHPETAVVPDYRRRPDAELALERAAARGA
jgi:hypothetical protein